MAQIQVLAKDLKPYDQTAHDTVIQVMVYGDSGQYVDVALMSRSTNRRYTIEATANDIWTIEERQNG